MERRKSKRIPYFIDASIMCGDDIYDGIIGNISKNGFECIVTSVTKSLNNIIPHKKIELNYQDPLGDDIIDLKCKVVWIKRPYKKSMVIGLKILYLSSKYNKFISSLIY
ncbi:MAG: PilZ domain-containing protein [Nitrospiraceae bacterium]|nr:MAG: PilZ domain-containing protein [Nitrospiraceae bacterium]